MLLVTKKAIVCIDEELDPLLYKVRANFKGDIERLFPRANVTQNPRARFLYEAIVLRTDTIEALSDLVEDGDLGESASPEHEETYQSILAQLRQIQHQHIRRMRNDIEHQGHS